jgi:RimJ/RimL family protein N-acetyltransferase
MFAIVDGDVGIGGIGWWLAQWRGDDVYETGWSVVPEAQGKGAAGAALALVIEDARLHGERSLLTAFPSVANPASNRLCASAGFAHAGVEESEFRGSMLTVNAWTLDLATPH